MHWPTPSKRTKSLGWALVDIIEAELLVPTGLDAGVPLKLTDEQVDLYVAWYEVIRVGKGAKWKYRRGAVRLPKKWGKSPWAAGLCYGELVGPVVFDHWDDDGQPAGRPHPAPRVQIAGTSEDNTDNTFMALYEMLRNNPVVAERGLDVGLTRIGFKSASGLIEPVTSSSTSREGNPVTFILEDETQHWSKTNGGVELAATHRRNAAPLGYRTMETCNAFAPGEGSVAESTAESSTKRNDILYVAREAPSIDISDRDKIDRVLLRAALLYAYGDSARDNGGWVDVDGLVEEFFDESNDLAELCRWYLNQIIAPSEAMIDLTKITRVNDTLHAGDVIALGFDGGDSGDCTALYAVRWPDWLLVKLGVWEGRTPRSEVDAEVRKACTTYRVVRGHFDPPLWQTEIDNWHAEFGDAVLRFPHMSDQRIGPASERFAAMTSQLKFQTSDQTIIAHIANGRRGSAGRQGWRPARKHQGRPIDAASAAIGAVDALGKAIELGLVVAQPEPMFAFTT